MKNKGIRKLIALLLIASCGSVLLLQKGVTQPSELSLAEKYLTAIQDAALVDEKEVFIDLMQITPDNPRLSSSWNEDKTKILVVTWKSEASYEKYIKPANNSSRDEEKVIWVTVAPELKEFCKKYLQNNPGATEEDLNLRLKQYLGLDPNWNYDIFVEMWVNPQDLIRPCVDPEVTDGKCNLDFEEQIPRVAGVTQDAGIKDYKLFYQNLYYKSIRRGLQPFTGLGYTYDWSGLNPPIGASEFILVPRAAYTVNENPVPTFEYCQP